MKLKSELQALALEPRLLFDGAGAIAADAALEDFDVPQHDAHTESGTAEPLVITGLEGSEDGEGIQLFGLNTADSPANITLTDKLDTNQKTLVGEDADSTSVGTTIETKGDGEVSVTIQVEKGLISTSNDFANAGASLTLTASSKAELDTLLDSLQYRYTGTSEVGDTDTLSITVKDDQGTSTLTRDLTIFAQNDAPTMSTDSEDYVRLEVNEGGNASFAEVGKLDNDVEGAELGAFQANLGLLDPDNKAEQIILKVNSLPEYGHLELNGVKLAAGATFALDEIHLLKYVHDGSQVLAPTTDQFNITVDDGAGGLLTDQVVFIDLKPVNDLPTVSGTVTIIQGEGPINLGGGSGSSLPVIGGDRGALTGVDPDDTNLTYTITSLPAEGEGTLYYDGVALTSADLGNVSFIDLSKLSFEYPKGKEPTSLTTPGQVSFTLTVQDQGGGTGTPSVPQSVTVNLTILDNNNDPYFETTLPQPDASGVITVTEVDYATLDPQPTGGLLITPDILPLKDADSFNPNLVFTVVESNATKGGYFTLDGKLIAAQDGKNVSFSMQDVIDGKVTYHFHGNGTPDHVDFLDFTVTDSGKTIVFPDSGDAYVRDGGIYRSDAENAELQVFRLAIKVPVTTGEGVLPALPELAESFDIQGSKEFDISEGQGSLGNSVGVTIGTGVLDTTDRVSSPEEIVYRLETAPTSGTLYLDGKALKQFDSFTQKDINDNKLVFKHSGSEQFSDGFNFSVSNGNIVNGDATNRVTITITPQNDTPVANTQEVAVAEGGTVQFTGTDISLSDADNHGNSNDYDSSGYNQENVLSFVVTTLPAHGTLLLNGVPVTENQEISQADLLAGKLTYQHNGTEQYQDSFTLRPKDNQGVVDDKITDTNQASLGEEVTLNLVINPVNDAPTFVGKSEPTESNPVLEGGQITIWGAGSYNGGMDGKTGSGQANIPSGEGKDYYLIYQDSDNTNVQRQYRVTEAPKFGTLTLDGKALSVGSVFTQADLDAGRIQYQHDGSANYADGFDYVVSDGDWASNESSKDSGDTKTSGDGIFAQGEATTSSRYHIVLAPANDAPEISATDSKPVLVSGVSDNLGGDPFTAGSSLGNFTITDPDLDDPLEQGHGKNTNHIRVTVAAPEGLLLHFGQSVPDGIKLVTGGENNSPSKTLVFEGARDEVQALLNSLRVTIDSSQPNTDLNQDGLKVTITVDDRLYDDTGTIIGANGGNKNEGNVDLSDAFNTAVIDVTVYASSSNDAPVFTDTTPDQFVVNEDGYNGTNGRTQLQTDSQVIAFTDADDFGSANNTLTLTVSEHGKLYFGTSGTSLPAGVSVEAGAVGSNTVTLKGTQAALNAALANLYYASSKDFNGHDTLKVTINDGGNMGEATHGDALEVSKDIAIHIVPVNDTPSLSLPGSEGYHTLTGSYEFSDKNNNAISFTDPDRKPETGGFDAGTGHQYAADNHKYTITLEATIDTSHHGQIVFLDAQGQPLAAGTLPEGISIVEGSDGTSGKLVITGTYDALTAALNNGIRYTPPESTEGVEDTNISFKVTVNDNGDGGTALTDPNTNESGLVDGLTDSKELIFQRTDKNDAPEFTLSHTPTHVEGGAPTILDPNAKVTDEELDLFSKNGGSWAGAELTVQRGEWVGGAATPTVPNEPHTGDTFAVSTTGGVSTSGNDVSVDGTVVGTITQSGGKLSIVFNDQATSERVQKVLQSISYQNTESTDALKDYGDEAKLQIIYSLNDHSPTEADSTSTGQYQGEGGPLIGYGKIDLVINRQIVANNDQNSVVEPSDGNATSVSGDLTPTQDANDDTDKEDVDPDAGQPIYVVGITAGSGTTDFTAVDETGTVEINGKYGTLTVQQDGSYTYTVDPNNLTVQGLKEGESLSDEVFRYKVSDGQGDFSTYDSATLTITINGSNDPVIVEVATQPPAGPVSPADKESTNGDQLHVVFESGLDDGSNPNTNHLQVNGSLTIQALDGLATDNALQLGYVDKDGTAQTLTLSKEQLEALTSSNTVTLTTQYGTLTLNGYQLDTTSDSLADGKGSITVNYHYELTGASAEHTADAPVFDEITVHAHDRDTDTDSSSIRIQIMDDVPQAQPDTNQVRSGDTVTVAEIEKGLLANDHSGADGWNAEGAVVGVVAGVSTEPGATTPNTDGSYTVVGTYGTLTVNADGTYSYQANANTPADSTEVFSYTVSDADGDLSVTTLIITISEHGLTAPEPTEGTVQESGLPGGSGTPGQGTTVSGDIPLDGTLTVDPQTTTDKHGTFTVDENGKWSYKLTSPVENSEGSDEFTQTFTYTVKDPQGNTVTSTVTITVVDDAPKATNDSATVGSGATVTGDLTSNDQSGADGWKAGGAIVGVTTGSSGTATPTAPNDEGRYVLQGTHGTLTVNPDGTYSYQANPNTPAGSIDEFSYTVSDADDDLSAATLTITIQEVILPETPTTGTVQEAHLSDGSNPQSQGAQVTESLGLPSGQVPEKVLTPPQYGTVSVDPNTGEYTYTLTKAVDKGITQDTFTYQAKDEYGNIVENTVTIIIVDDGPKATADTNSVRSGDRLDVTDPAQGILGNDRSGADGWKDSGAIVGIVSGTSTEPSATTPNANGGYTVVGTHGTLTVNEDGTYSYQANANTPAGSTEVFSYTVSDADGDLSVTTLTITINDHGLTTPPPIEGTVQESGLNGGSGTPGQGTTVGGDIPLDGTLTVDPQATTDEHGTFTVDENGKWSYELSSPVTNPDGSDKTVKEFTYTAKDPQGNTVTSTVTVTIVDDQPVAVADSNSVRSGDRLDVTDPAEGILGNDHSGVDGWKDSGAIVGIVSGKHSDPSASIPNANGGYTVVGTYGTLTVHADGTYSYEVKSSTPKGSVDVFSYTVSDADGDLSVATLTITVDRDLPADNFPEWQPSGQHPNLPTGEVVIPENILRPRNPMYENQVGDPSVFFEGTVFNKVQRMPIPFHPIVYVNRQVQSAQLERESSDQAFRARPDQVSYGETSLSSLGAGLGAVPDLFVEDAVRGSQGQSLAQRHSIEGRLSRLSLSADMQLPTPGLANPLGVGEPLGGSSDNARRSAASSEPVDNGTERVEPQNLDVNKTEPQPEGVNAEGNDAAAETPTLDTMSENGELSFNTEPQAGLGAPSFSQLLQQGRQHLPTILFVEHPSA